MNRLEQRLQRVELEAETNRRDANIVRVENAQLRADLANIQNSSASYHGPPAQVPHHVNYGMPPAEQQQQLPPLRNIPGPEVMNGVQYQHDQRAGAYRAGDRF